MIMIQTTPQNERFLQHSEMLCENPDYSQYFHLASTPQQIVRGIAICRQCPSLDQCADYADSYPADTLTGVIAGKHYSLEGETEKTDSGQTRKIRTKICEGCGQPFQIRNRKTNQRYCTRSCRYKKED